LRSQASARFQRHERIREDQLSVQAGRPHVAGLVDEFAQRLLRGRMVLAGHCRARVRDRRVREFANAARQPDHAFSSRAWSRRSPAARTSSSWTCASSSFTLRLRQFLGAAQPRPEGEQLLAAPEL